jgi:hypothetical protein
MEEQKEPPTPIIDQLKEYADTQIKLAKYEAIDHGAKFLANLVIDVIIGVSFLLAFFFLSLALAFVLSKWLGSNWAGFGCMAGLYLVIALIVIGTKNKMRPPLIDLFIRNFFK